MYTLTTEADDYYCHVACECGRKYRAEEMYICYNCNKIICRFCLSFEYEFYCCKNNCKRNQYLNTSNSRKKRNSCDACLDCPFCFNSLVKKCNNKMFMYACPYCYWDTSNIKFAKEKEGELDSLIGQLKEASCSGYLNKMYLQCLNKLKENGLFGTEGPAFMPRASGLSSLPMDADRIVKIAMETKTMSMEMLEEKMKEEEKEIELKNQISYDDNYICNQNNAYFSFHFVSTLLASNLDYSETNWSQFDSIDALKSKLHNELDINYVSSLEQRHRNVTLQHPFTNIQFPKFTDLIPQRAKSSKKCKNCKKLVIQAGEVSTGKALDTKLEIAHLFLLQFPYISFSKIDTVKKRLMLKFSLLDYKEITISFREDIDSPLKVILPPEKYEIGTNKEYEPNEYFCSKSDKFIVLCFQVKESHHAAIEVNGSCHLVRFFIKSEYNRGGSETAKELEYPIELKFKVSSAQ